MTVMDSEITYLEAVSARYAHHPLSADFCHSGPCDDAALPDHLANIFASLPTLSKKMGRSAQAIFIELFQNIHRYGARTESCAIPLGHITISHRQSAHETSLEIVASNIVGKANLPQLQKVLDEFFIYQDSQLKTRYLHQLLHPENTQDSPLSAGLGLLEISRRSAGRMSIELTQEEHNPAIVTITCTLKEAQLKEKFYLSATSRTPEISFDPDKGLLEITGECYPENIARFFTQIEQLVQAYLEKTPPTLTVAINLSYFNSGSARALLELTQSLDHAAEKGVSIQIEWGFDPEDDISQEFASDIAGQTQFLDFKLNANIEEAKQSV